MATVKKLSFIALIFLFLFPMLTGHALAAGNQKINDFAELLTSEQVEQLERLANSYSEETEVDIVVLTTSQTNGKSIEQFMGDFYDEIGLGYDQRHGNTVILTLDMNEREVYVAGFYKGEHYINNERADFIRQEITPYLSEGDFYGAFKNYIELTRHYLGIEPVVTSEPIQNQPINNEQARVITNTPNQENIFFELWFQLLISGGVGAIAVGIMGYHSSGRKTTNSRTYLDESRSAVTASRDTFIRKTVTKVKRPTNNNNNSSGGFGGGGFTGGGRSHSGSKGRF